MFEFPVAGRGWRELDEQRLGLLTGSVHSHPLHQEILNEFERCKPTLWREPEFPPVHRADIHGMATAGRRE